MAKKAIIETISGHITALKTELDEEIAGSGWKDALALAIIIRREIDILIENIPPPGQEE